MAIRRGVLDDLDAVGFVCTTARPGVGRRREPLARRSNREHKVTRSTTLTETDVCDDVKCFALTSSGDVYGLPPVRRVRRGAPSARRLCGMGKLATEQDAHVARSMFGLEHLVLRRPTCTARVRQAGMRQAWNPRGA